MSTGHPFLLRCMLRIFQTDKSGRKDLVKDDTGHTFTEQKGKAGMTRREIREQIFQMLFRIEFYGPEERKEQMQYETDEERKKNRDEVYIQDKINDVNEHLEQIDAIINEAAHGWKTSRMGKVDLTLLRLAVYEIRFEEDIPTGVAINEAVELAKKYGTESSPAFINGILAKIA